MTSPNHINLTNDDPEVAGERTVEPQTQLTDTEARYVAQTLGPKVTGMLVELGE